MGWKTLSQAAEAGATSAIRPVTAMIATRKDLMASLLLRRSRTEQSPVPPAPRGHLSPSGPIFLADAPCAKVIFFTLILLGGKARAVGVKSTKKRDGAR